MTISSISGTSVALFAAAWWALAGMDIDAWPAGIIAVGGAALLHGALRHDRPAARLRIRGLAAFVPHFLGLALRGGLDVSRRALSPSLPVAPDLMSYRVRLPDGAPLVLFMNTLSLLPGTFSAELEGSELTVHVLTRAATDTSRLRALEKRVAAVFGLRLAGEGGTE